MAPMNRPTNDSFMRSKRPATTADEPPAKRPKQVEDGSKKERNPPTSSNVPRAAALAKPREEEAAFPRGGASVLTPLEHKQIQIDATRDVLFEQESAAKRSAADVANGTSKKSGLKGRKSKDTSKKGSSKAEADEEQIKIEGLSYKRLLPGSLVLGQISQINDHDVAVALPNNLTGYLPITSISDQLSHRIEKMAAAGEVEDDESGERDDVELASIFRMGQYLRAYVVSTSDAAESKTGEKAKRRIELSTAPRQANHGLSTKELVVNSMLMASVISVEDHGLIMDIGMEEATIRGFMSSKEVTYTLDAAMMQPGQVVLCMITGLSANGKTVKLSADSQKFASSKKLACLVEAPTIDAFLPGTVTEVLITDITHKGIAGKIMGMLDVTADIMHSGAGASGKELEKKYKIGGKVRARIICTFPKSQPKKLGASLLDHVLSLSPLQAKQHSGKVDPLSALSLSSIVEKVIVKQVEPGIGLFVDVGVHGVPGFVHISRVTDDKIETLSESSGPYKFGSEHRGRIIGYNAIDGVFLVSLEPKILEQAFLRIEDIKIGQIVKGKVEKIVINAVGVGGILVNLADGITGLVPEMHMADVALLHPEKKFKEGVAVTARVLSTDPSKRQLRLTLKKTLINSEAIPWLSFDEIVPGMQSPGTIVNVLSSGAVVQFYGTIRGFLPVSEMSEAYIADPSQHFRIGQVVNVHVLNIDPEAAKLTVSCKDPAAFGIAQQTAIKKLKLGEIVSATVTEKSEDDVSVELSGSHLRARIPLGQISDGSENKNASTAKKIRVGQALTELVVLDKNEQKHSITLSNKPSLVQAAKGRTLLRTFEDVKEGRVVSGFVKNITATAIFVQFAGGVTGLLPKGRLIGDVANLTNFGFRKTQSVTSKIVSVDNEQQRFLLSMKDLTNVTTSTESASATKTLDDILGSAINPVDERVKDIGDFSMNALTKARIVSVKDTQINVALADNVQGRIDVSQIFDSWDEIKDRKHPLQSFANKQILDVRILGVHDARNHRFLPISHRVGKTLVFELSAKKSDQIEKTKATLTLDRVQKGSSWIGFVNNVGEDCLWVNLSPNVRGRISALDVSDDVTISSDLESNFPIGSAIKVNVINVDLPSNRLDLSARSVSAAEKLTFKNISRDMVVPGKVTKSSERQVMVQLSDTLSAPIHLTDLADDFSEANPSLFAKNDIIRVCITDIDVPNKRIRLSTRPSRVLNSSLPVKDAEISSANQVQPNSIIRGFIKNITDKGVFINLGGNVAAYVRVSDLSDQYLKDWKDHFQVDQLVKGRVLSVDADLNHVQLSLKTSVTDANYVAPLKFEDLAIGRIVTGKVRKVEDFGAFIVLDGSNNVSGLCHKSEMAEKRVEDPKKLYQEGDAVKAIVLKLEKDTKRVSLGLKVSYFADRSGEADENDDTEEDDKDDDHGDEGINGVDIDDEAVSESDGGANIDAMDVDDAPESDLEQDDTSSVAAAAVSEDEDIPALGTGGFDWSGHQMDTAAAIDSGSDGEVTKKKKKKRSTAITIDRTGDLDAFGPQTPSDFERLLLGQPNTSSLWIQYMAYYVQLSELPKARDVAERAIATINMREETEKLNMWIALLNLEVVYGSDESIEDVFTRACTFNDPQEVGERLASIYIQSSKTEKADILFTTLIKKHSQAPTIWTNYAHFLYTTAHAPDRARGLLPRAIQALANHTHLALTTKFAAMEFRCESGSAERGRTMFEGLLSTFPKRLDLWGQLVDLEIAAMEKSESGSTATSNTKAGRNGKSNGRDVKGDGDVGKESRELVRGVFERAVRVKGLKPKGVKAWFKRWSAWEEMNGGKREQERVRAKAEAWVREAAERKVVSNE